MRHPKPTNDCCGCNRVRRRDNRSERKSSRPGKSRHNRVCNPGNRNHRRQHQADSKQEYRPQITPKITPRCEQRRRINKCRENEVEDGVGIEFHLRQSRHETQGESADHQHNWVRQSKFTRDHGEDRYSRKQQHNDFRLMHVQIANCCSRLAVSRWLVRSHAHGDTAPWLQLCVHFRSTSISRGQRLQPQL